MKKTSLSISIITKNAGKTLRKTLASVKGLADEIVIIDSFSNDNTVGIAEKYTTLIYQNTYEGEGIQRKIGLNKLKSEWVLVLDADEAVTDDLRKEIIRITKSNEKFNGYSVPVQSYFLGKPINHGGENYSKMILFKREFGYSTQDEIHAYYKIKEGKIGTIKSHLDHYSYISIWQMFSKFTNYGGRMAREKLRNGEKSNVVKLFTYPIHMFWSRFVTDKGYKDGPIRIILDIGFGYMEFLTYFYMLTHKI